jgi:hypothetical protein
MRRERHAIGLAEAAYAVICEKLDEYEVTAAEMGRGVADDEGLNALKYQEEESSFLKKRSKKLLPIAPDTVGQRAPE